ncbi:hypothetical protein ACFQBQ_07055 [Granulicella cerasi]|uniref:NolW-like domain-containing protein n=1 Tax=Granulicella cerasi TaxID=741063 RepID=A0ABW1Z7I6_9BACT|nr:hypothetical protein [Granulicella cerasi]
MHPHFTRRTLVVSLGTALLSSLPLHAQAKTPPANPCRPLTTRSECTQWRNDHDITKTIFLTNTTQQNDANEVLVALRNVLDPSIKIYLVASQNAIVVRTIPEDMAQAEALVADLTKPRKQYRLTYTVNTLEGKNRISSEVYSVVAVNGQRVTEKQGNKVPVITGSKDGELQYTYIDVGHALDATLSDGGSVVALKTKVEVSSPAPTPSMPTEPTIHQTVLEGSILLTPGKPLTLGSADIEGTHQRIEVEVLATPTN